MNTSGSNRENALEAVREMVVEARELQSAAGGSVTDSVAVWLGPQYLLATQAKLTAADGSGRFEVLRLFIQDWTLLRRGDQFAARQACRQSQKEAEFREWIQRPEVRQEFFPDQTGGFRQEMPARIEKELKLL